MSLLEEKLERHISTPGPARRQLKTLVRARGFKELTAGLVELTSPFGDKTYWRFESTSRSMEAWLHQVPPPTGEM
jgi:hypothetical protein